MVGHLTSSYDIARGHPMERCEVAGVKGRLVIEDMWREATLYPAGELVKSVYTNPVFGGYRDFDDTFRARLHTFLEQVDRRRRPGRDRRLRRRRPRRPNRHRRRHRIGQYRPGSVGSAGGNGRLSFQHKDTKSILYISEGIKVFVS